MRKKHAGLRSGCQVPNFVPWSVLFNYLVTDISKIEIVFGTWQTCFSSGKIYFEGRTVSFREGICLYRYHPLPIDPMEVHLNICTQNGVFSGKWDSNDLYNVRCWFPTSYADLYFIPCLYG